MKNTFKFLGIIALVAVIGFSMVAALSLTGCDTDGGGGGGGSGGGGATVTITGTPKVGQTLTATSSGNVEGYFMWTVADSPDASFWTGQVDSFSGENRNQFTIYADLEGYYIKASRQRSDETSLAVSNILGPIQAAGGGGTTFTVTYNGNTNTGGAAPTDTNSPYQSGATVTVLGNTGNLVKTGNTFAGWNTAANGSGTAYNAGATFSITANTILYAQWTPTGGGGNITYTVSDNTYSNTTTGITFTFNAAVTGLTANDITVSNGTGAATKGSLYGSGTTWTLYITVTKPGTVNVSINKSGIESETKMVTVLNASIFTEFPEEFRGTWTKGGDTLVIGTTTFDFTRGSTVLNYTFKSGKTASGVYVNGQLMTHTFYFNEANVELDAAIINGRLIISVFSAMLDYEGEYNKQP